MYSVYNGIMKLVVAFTALIFANVFVEKVLVKLYRCFGSSELQTTSYMFQRYGADESPEVEEFQDALRKRKKPEDLISFDSRHALNRASRHHKDFELDQLA